MSISTYVILSRFSPESMRDPSDRRRLAETVSEKIKAGCPNVRWKASYALMGHFDVLDLVEAENPGRRREDGDGHPGLRACGHGDHGHALG